MTNDSRRFTGLAAMIAIATVVLAGMGCKKSTKESGANVEPGGEVAATPSAELTPNEVVKIQIRGLSDSIDESTGLRTAFGFSSPQHRILTGSLSEYQQLMDAPQYRPLRECVSVDYFEPEIDGNQAQQIVALTDSDGQVSFYLFMLSRQLHGDNQGCWMTDAVQSSRYSHQSEATSSAST